MATKEPPRSTRASPDRGPSGFSPGEAEWAAVLAAAGFLLHRANTGTVSWIGAGVSHTLQLSLFGACAHLGGPLSEGSVQQVRGRDCLVCPWHDSAFELDAGQPTRGPAAVPQEKLLVRHEGGRVLARLAGRHTGDD